MKAPDAKQFKEAMVKEVNDHTSRKHWEPIEKKDVPPGEKILPAVWAMKRKRRIDTREVYKWKSRLNLGGHKMEEFIDYYLTYAPALAWSTIRLFLSLSVIHGWKTRQLDFVLAYPQAPASKVRYMELPKGVHMPGLDRNKHCLKILQNIYGARDAGRTWFLYLKAGLEELGFTPSAHDDCVFYRGTSVLLVYTDDCILIDKDSEANIDEVVRLLQTKFNVGDEGSLEDYLGVRVDKLEDGNYHLCQPQLIDSILKDLNLIDERGIARPGAKSKDNPSQTTKLLGPDSDGPPLEVDWDYRSMVGKLNHLYQTTRGELGYQVSQLSRFLSNPKASHGAAIKQIGRYLLGTRDKGVYLRPDSEQLFECYVDADFCGNWDRAIAADDPDTAKSRAGYVIKFATVPLFWCSKLMSQFALSTAEAEYLALSQATRKLKPMMYLLEEINSKFTPVSFTPRVYCRLFEDNSAALEMAKVPKMRPRTRYINAQYHHFRAEVANGRLIVLPIESALQQGDLFTHVCDVEKLQRHRKAVLGW